MDAKIELHERTTSDRSMQAWLCLSILLIVSVPQFLCAPITNDASHYDIQALIALRGGVLYRDVVEPNLPGVVWIHMAVRSVAGWSSEALRGFDLVTFLVTAGLLGLWTFRASGCRSAGVWTTFSLTLVYFSLSEWCQTQRDVWQLLPVVVALMLRRRQISRLHETSIHPRGIAGWALLEGLCLGVGVWIKPHLLIPAACVWTVSVQRTPRNAVAADFSGLLSGGLIAGGAGIAWMVSAEAWSPLLDILLNWNPEYLQSGKRMWGRFAVRGPIVRLLPFSLVHLFSIPIALSVLFTRPIPGTRSSTDHKLLSTLYLGWCVQVVLLQNPLDYIHVVPILIGTVLLIIWLSTAWKKKTSRRFLGYVCLSAAVAYSPIKDINRVRLWSRCVREGSTGVIRNELAQISYPNWEDLECVDNFIRATGATQDEVTCWSSDLIQIHLAAR